MIENVILPGTTREEWPGIRASIRRRIEESFGVPETPPSGGKAPFGEIDRYERHGLTHVVIRYHVIGDEWNEGICVVPAGASAAHPAPAVLTCHGSNGELGKLGVLDPENLPDRAYGIELARRGYVTFSVDQFGFGKVLREHTREQVAEEFYRRHPRWSLTGRRILEHRRALDVLEQLPFVRPGAFAVMGHSLGGYTTLCLSAFDERVAAAVASAGVSPNLYNVYRSITVNRAAEPQFVAHVEEHRGRMPWEKQEMLALCAPRAFLMIEPYNDPYNPCIVPTFECMAKAADVYRLLGAPEKLATVVHGDGHTTLPRIREFAYGWIERFVPLHPQPGE